MLAITRVSLALCTAIYLATSLAGYLLFGTSTASDILVNFDRDLGLGGAEAAVNVAIRCSYVLHIILVFPIIFYSVRSRRGCGTIFWRTTPGCSQRTMPSAH